MRVGMLIAVALTLLLGTVPSSATTPAAHTYLAKLDRAPAGSQAALVRQAGRFEGYVCSPDPTVTRTFARWYRGAVDGFGGFRAVLPEGIDFSGNVDGARFAGTVRNRAGTTFAFIGARVSAGPAGLYRGMVTYRGHAVTVGAIVGSDGTFCAAAHSGARLAAETERSPERLARDRIAVRIGPERTRAVLSLVTRLATSP
ncbi:MAG: hypothetical protein QN163_00030 [Armatimonadota bacterium]|nr:hypothetical protein [Armatimonadota bacterium]MDR5696783.1 hypothetical protein [Armatimonadota bacterium]